MGPDLAGSFVAGADPQDEIAASPYFNPDLAPTTMSQRTWRLRDMAALWVAMAACVPTYMLASSLIDEGMNWWQAVLTIVLANIIVLVPMILNGHAGTKYGIPFPVYCRPAFGIRGANVPALLRAFVACGWFGIQTWIGGWAIYKILEVYLPSWKTLPTHAYFAINLPQFLCFLFFWAINLVVIYRGIDSIRFLLEIKAPLLIVLGLALLAWAYREAGGFGLMLNQPSQFSVCGPKAGGFWTFSQRDQALGQAVALPPAMGLFSFIGVAVASGTIVISGRAIWDPVELVARFEAPLVHVVALLGLCLATLATNIAANVVSPANDFANLWPRRISFRTGGLITGLVGIVMQPWKLVTDPSVYIFKWLIAYSALLGAVGGVLIADYFLVRHTRLDLPGLYRRGGPYWYRRGFHVPALVALAAGIAPCLPGFLATVAEVKVPAAWPELYNYAWFVSFGLSFAVYAAWLRCAPFARYSCSESRG